jgi:hypothetical protein
MQEKGKTEEMYEMDTQNVRNGHTNVRNFYKYAPRYRTRPYTSEITRMNTKDAQEQGEHSARIIYRRVPPKSKENCQSLGKFENYPLKHIRKTTAQGESDNRAGM